MTLLILVPISQAVGCAAGLFRAHADFHTTADFDGVKQVSVETRNGAIEVQCVAGRSDVDIQAKRHASGITVGDALAHAEMIEIEAKRDPGQPDLLRIVAVFPPSELGRNYGAAFTIALPPDVSLTLTTKNGRVHAAGVNGDVSIETTNGAVELEDITGQVKARSSNGRMTLRDVDGDVELKTSNGTVDLARVGKDHITVETTNGRIRTADLRGEVYVRSSNGTIDLNIVSVPGSPQIRAVTSNGRIRVACPAAVSAKLRMRTSNGRVHANLKDVTVKDFESSRRLLVATINDGGGLIDIESSNGSISFETIGSATKQ
jgi:hypothetical protein